jgi:hypothetical protein
MRVTRQESDPFVDFRRRAATVARLRDYRALECELHSEYAKHLQDKLRVAAQRARERNLQNHVRVNLRRVAAEKAARVRSDAKKDAALDVLAKEARLESLRRVARQRLGLDYVQDEVCFSMME